jgi:hypothetical protein
MEGMTGDEMEIEEHLTPHDGVLRAKAREIGGKAGVVEDCYSAGVLALIEVHAAAGYQHDKAELITYAWRRVLEYMRAIVAPPLCAYDGCDEARPPDARADWRYCSPRHRKAAQRKRDNMQVSGTKA